MKKDFVIGQSNELVKDGQIFDLHNHFDFACLCINTKKRELYLLFEPNPEYTESRSVVCIVFREVDYLELSPGFGSRRLSDLDEMGYKSPRDRDDEWLLGEEQASPEDHMFFRFIGDDYIRVHSSEALITSHPGCWKLGN
jgi:hypothetical protein